MTIKEARHILKKYNKWRQGAKIPMPEPKDITKAIDVAIDELKKIVKAQRINNKLK